MGLKGEQRKQLAAIRKLIKSKEWADVKQGLALLESVKDEDIWAIFAAGIRLSSDGALMDSSVELRKRMTHAFRINATLSAARHAGLLDSLTHLDLRPPWGGGREHGALRDISPLSGLTALTDLNLHREWNVSDFAPLATLKNLTHLNISFCSQVADLRPLAALTNLTHLNIRACSQVADLRPLAALTNLVQLDLSCTDVHDLRPLQGMTQLTRLSLEGCTAVVDLHPLKTLTTLTWLHLGGDQNQAHSALTDLSALSGLTGLQRLSLSDCTGLRDIRPLQELTALTYLSLSIHHRYGVTTLDDLRPLHALKSLTHLDLRWRGLSRDESAALQEALPHCHGLHD